jgi:cytoplasmic iron level regulating protein YaaA (DUF328/UPF0246 family)
MKILLSPAKSLDYDQKIETPFTETAHFLQEADYLAQKLQKISKKELGKLMKISENLSDLNYKRYQEWKKPTVINENAKPAVTVFTGEAYKGLDVSTFSKKDFKNAQKDLMILSGLYGILKPLDLMYPYRLEMGTRWNVTPKTKNLYAYWGSQLADYINKEAQEDEVIINLASNEYYKAVDQKVLKPRVITPVFKDLKGDQFKIIMMYAKHARGAMTRDIIQNQYKNTEDLKGYNVDGYSYNDGMSSENEWVFVR